MILFLFFFLFLSLYIFSEKNEYKENMSKKSLQ